MLYTETEHELNYLKNLGRGVHVEVPTSSRLVLLKKYSRVMNLREWGKIDKTKIARYVKDAITREGKCIQ